MVETVGLLTLLAVEMDMQVVVNVVVMTVAKLVANTVATILDDVYQMLFTEE